MQRRLFVLGLVALAMGLAHGEVLTPPYFNLASGRKINATHTCGEGEGVEGPELYCKLVGASTDSDINLIQGQVCDICDPTRSDKRHPAEYAIDGSETWWQSPPLSRNMRLNEVNLTIDFGQAFHVAYVFVRMANSPRPGVWALEKSMDYGKTFVPWQYFADSENDCEIYFGKETLQRITRDDSVICDTQFSKVLPLENGEIVVSILNNRPSAKNFFNSTILQDWTRATNVRLRLLRTKTLLGHLMSVARQDPTVTRRYFYSIKDISIGGRCMCNGYADTCDNTDPSRPYKLACQCKRNTYGDECEQCHPAYRQLAWRINRHDDPFACEPCNCFGHADSCEYSEEVDKEHKSIDIHGQYIGGGVCQNCRHNTQGINCNECIDGYYRPYSRALNATDVCERCNCNYFFSTGNCSDGDGKCECKPAFRAPDCDTCNYGYFGYPDCRPCDCFLNGTRGYYCDAKGGSCPCLPNYGGQYCKECAEEYYNFPDCLPCECDGVGALTTKCETKSGNCTCKRNFGGRSCNRCAHGYFNYPECTYCSCDSQGTVEEVCDKGNGLCICKEGYTGDRCDQCLPGYYGYPDCHPCNCTTGSSSYVCDATGKCPCLSSFSGRTCNSCSPGFYQYPECLPCGCDDRGSDGISCNANGICQCKKNFQGDKCTSCQADFYNFPLCEECNCNPAGTAVGFPGCGSLPPGELCQCKPRVHGRTCDKCRPLFWDLAANNAEGCSDCGCNPSGVLGGILECNQNSGQCVCKPGVESVHCDTCRNEFFQLQESDLFGCSPCNCDIGGSVDNLCDKVTGHCQCHPRVGGRDCSRALNQHYFPTLYSQLQFELEDGHTPSESPVRYDFNEKIFPGYSWKGYAVFSHLQPEVLQEVHVSKPSEYRLILRYVNPSGNASTGVIKVMPENPAVEVSQTFPLLLKPTTEPTFHTVVGPIVMNSAGAWTVKIALNGALFVDYFVLLPAAFYEATILEKRVENPCTGENPAICRHFAYPSLPFSKVAGGSFFITEEQVPARDFYTNPTHLSKLGLSEAPALTATQPDISVEMTVADPGRYVLVVEYISPVHEQRSFPVNVNVAPGQGIGPGHLQLVPCPYDMPCRQVVTDDRGRINVFTIDDIVTQVTFKTAPEWNSTIAFVGVTAVPLEKWSLDFIQPSSVCIKKDDQCIKASFPNTFDSSAKVEFESSGSPVVDSLPSHISDKKAVLVELTPQSGNLTINATGLAPGYYVVVAHYYQPLSPKFTIPATVFSGNQKQEAQLVLGHCPGNSGCRTPLEPTSGSSGGSGAPKEIYIDSDFSLTLAPPPRYNVLLDYVLVVPLQEYSAIILDEELIDQSALFIAECGKDHFYIDPNATGFCREAVFSLTMEHYVGALRCECSYVGSLSFECAPLGGQCQCKPNVVGRRCQTCKSGYYGFPNCRPCHCPAGVCEPETGECVCPYNVHGEVCDQCMPRTWGYDRIHGCVECNCNPHGVQDHNLDCDADYGHCSCKKNIVGHRCDKCLAGHWYFPHCQQCACDLRGTTEEICDQETSTCLCKPNVHGQACDLCKDGKFHLSEANPKGCTECFCFGRTNRCSSSNLYLSQVSGLDGWQLAAVEVKDGQVKVELFEEPPELIQEGSEQQLGADFTVNEFRDSVVYFMAPDTYLGNKITSYGSNLTYTIFYTSGTFGNAVMGADAILYGANTYLLYSSMEQPAASAPFEVKLTLVENNFREATGFPATREKIMVVLQALKAIYIRATYWESSITTRLSNMTLDIATADFDPEAVHTLSVEQCQCPPNYQGLSCEECAPGFFRSNTGPYGGYCVPCQCNGHSEDCDAVTGKCLDCKHNTHGDHCEFCEVGFHGNATYGSPFDCLICACPLPTPSNNFATGCEVSDDGGLISCDCLPGYGGARCEYCSSGFFGEPEVQGSSCQQCNCSGNIDIYDPAGCNSINGKCEKCLNYTFGESCELCAPMFSGDAILLKDCKKCDCVECGSVSCESHTGQCVCQDNVVGETCDRCAPNHFNFDKCQGCLPCECGAAAVGPACDDVTGNCVCQPGVVGRTCEKCAPGFWNYTVKGCQSCGCNTEFSVGVGCNPATGKCECLPGVIGDRCDQCPLRWVLKPDEGCFECDNCTHDLLDTTDSLHQLIGSINDDIGSLAGGYFTIQRLKHINDSAVALTERVSSLDPVQFDLKSVITPVEALENDVRNSLRQIEFAEERAELMAAESERVRVKARDLEENVTRARDTAGNTVLEVSNLAYSLDGSAAPHVDFAVKEAEDILKDLEQMSAKYLPMVERANTQLENASAARTSMEESTKPVYQHSLKVDNLADDISKFDNKLQDLQNNSYSALRTAQKAAVMNLANRQSNLPQKVDLLNEITKDADLAIADAKALLANASLAVSDTQEAARAMDKEKEMRLEARNNLEMSVREQSQNLDDLEPPVRTARIHAEDLANRAKTLNESLQESRNFSGHSVQAARSYGDIADAISDAQLTGTAAVALGQQAFSKSDGLDQRARDSLEASEKLLEAARNATILVLNDLRGQLAGAKNRVDTIATQTSDAQDIASKIEKELEKTQDDQSLSETSSRAIAESDIANLTTSQKIADISAIIDKLPDGVAAAKKLPKDVGAIKLELSQARSELDRVNNILPDLNKLIDNLNGSKRQLEESGGLVDKQIDRLKRQVAQARDLASRIKLGVTFMPSTYIQIKNPENLVMQSTSTKVSGFFKANTENGALLYIGNEEGTSRRLPRMKTDDFLAVELENGYPAVVIDLGSGAYRINSPLRVEQDTWYQYKVERTGKHVKFIVTEERDGKEVEHIKEEVIPGSASILNLDPEESKIYVGGMPDRNKIQSAVKYDTFFGQMEDLMIGDTPISLWNFRDASNNNGGLERSGLINPSPSTGYRFSGNGYVSLNSSSYRMSSRTSVILKFKTSAHEGLLFAAGRGPSFLSVELQGGFMVYQYNLGSGVAELRSGTPVNDNKWHQVEAVRSGSDGVLSIDDVQEATDKSEGDETNLLVSDLMYFGGYPGMHKWPSVSNVDFDGCIDGVRIDGTSVDLSKHVSAFGVSPGCPNKFASTVSFLKKRPGYISWPNATATEGIDVSLRFKTQHHTGLLLMVNTRNNHQPFSLALVDGKVVVNSAGATLSSDNRYDDNEWHALTVTHSQGLVLSVDDYETIPESNVSPPQEFRFASLLVGGVTPSFELSSDHRTIDNYQGCIADVAFNGVLINFANVTEVSGAVVGKCADPDSSPGEPVGVIPAVREPKVIQTTTTTPAPPPALPTPKPTPAGLCALPLNPATDEAATFETNGYRFGLASGSRLEFNKLPQKLGKRLLRFSFEFKTNYPDGIIFYAFKKRTDRIGVYLQDGIVKYIFNMGSGEKVLSGSERYDDGLWHTVEISAEGNLGRLVVDKALVAEGESPGTTKELNLAGPFYVGGLNPEMIANVTTVNMMVKQSFEGCIRNIQMNGKPFQAPAVKVGVEPCSDHSEPGAFFHADGGYVKLADAFRVGSNITIKMMIKPRYVSGVLLSVHGRKDYLVLQMVDGAISFIVDNGRGAVSSTFKPPQNNKYFFCDGKWHFIHAVQAKNVVALSVNEENVDPGIGEPGSTVTDTRSPLLLGGVPRFGRARASVVPEQYVGCIKDVDINGRIHKIDVTKAVGNVTVAACPTI